jgi:hypothetical protein
LGLLNGGGQAAAAVGLDAPWVHSVED